MNSCFIFVDTPRAQEPQRGARTFSRPLRGNGFFKLVKREFENKYKKKLNFFKTFRNILANEGFNRKEIFIYDAPPYQSKNPSEKESMMQKNYHRFTRMAKTKKWINFREGSCVKIKLSNGNFKFSQKGVDALMIMDMYECIMNFPEVNKMILFASDSDFVPIVEKMKQNGKEVILYTYFDRIRGSRFSTSNQLLKSVSRWHQLRLEDFE